MHTAAWVFSSLFLPEVVSLAIYQYTRSFNPKSMANKKTDPHVL
jgi:hypothetical protein